MYVAIWFVSAQLLSFFRFDEAKYHDLMLNLF